MANEKKLSPEQAAVNAALALQYDKPATIIARKADAIDKAKGDTWSAFKDGARIGLEAGQTADTMAKGISLACANHSVPQGTVNAYLPVLKKLFKAVAEEGMDREIALTMTIADARAKWQPKKKKAAPATPAATTPAPSANGGEPSGDGGGDADGMLGATARSRLLSQINEALAALTDDDLTAVLDMLADFRQEDTPERKAA